MRAELLTAPRARDLPAGALLTRKRHLISEARRELRRDTRRLRRPALVGLACALALAVVLSTAALGVVGDVRSWIAGFQDPDSPVATRADVVIAAGVTGVAWKLVATPSDQGLCLFMVTHVDGETQGSGSCGYVDIRGDLPPDVRGDPSSTCLTAPTRVAPCGSLPHHWIDAGGGGSSAGFTQRIVFGLVAKQVASVELVLSDGDTLRAHVIEPPKGFDAPLKVYWAEWPCPLQAIDENLQECAEDGGPEVKMAIARDSAGRILERRVPAWNGNPTGDPPGPHPPWDKR